MYVNFLDDPVVFKYQIIKSFRVYKSVLLKEFLKFFSDFHINITDYKLLNFAHIIVGINQKLLPSKYAFWGWNKIYIQGPVDFYSSNPYGFSSIL